MHGEDGQVTINELWQQKNYRWCAEDVTLNECVKVYNAVMASDGMLVNNGEYIAYRDEENDEVHNTSL